MPYVENESTIKTKVIGVATKINDQDNMKIRQVILQRMQEEPNSVSLIFLRRSQVWVCFDDNQEFYLGDLKNKYEKLIMNNVTQIINHQVTGGYKIPEKTVKLAGMKTIVSGGGSRVNFGLNIYVKLI